MKQAVSNDLNSLADWCDNLAADLPNVISGHAKEVADAIITDIIENTPADTGTAISNWEVALGSPNTVTRDAFDPSPKGKMRKGLWVHTIDPIITFFANVPSTEGAAREILETKQPGQDIYITNNLPYIKRLNDDGYSHQVAAGFVERALELANVIISKIKYL